MNRLRTFWMATRPFAFPASVIPALLGGVVAVTHAGVRFDLPHFLLAALGAACVHAAANLLNDYYDYRSGVDRPGVEGASRGTLVTGRLTAHEVLIAGLILWGVSALFALYFVLAVGPVLLPLIGIGLLLGAGYTAAPTALKYRALGDLSVFVAFGVGITVGGYIVQAGAFSWTPVAYSVPMGLLIAAILHGNNLRDITSDREAGIKTMAMILGPRPARIVYALLLLFAYLSVIVFAATGIAVPTALLALLSLPLALGVVREVWPRGEHANGRGRLVNLDMRTAQLQMAFGLLLILGTLAPVFF
ncbi:MAG: prenyltransferase [Candidatus Eisenbacteria sp.]|nr:prenyltransferase [Candidatus Eisenbacteria bacterium]